MTPVTDQSLEAACRRIIRELFGSFDGGLAVRLGVVTYYLGKDKPEFTLVIHDARVLRTLVLRSSPLALVDAYFRGDVDVEGDLYAALRLRGHFQSMLLRWWMPAAIRLLFDATLLSFAPARPRRAVVPAEQFSHAHTRASDRAAITRHYDVSNGFYKLFLDRRLVYSCAYFDDAGTSLDDAQARKLDHVCRKLRLKPGERFLDIGCGWGALVIWAARHYGVQAHGITLSRAQLDEATERIAAEGLQDRITVELRDYRDLDGVYDKVASVGMFEHVGLANLPQYHAAVHRILQPNGLFLNHGITHELEGWDRTLDTEFINTYVFPDGELDLASNVQLSMERAGFEIHDVENLRQHYAITLRHWVARLEGQYREALAHVNEATYRTWRLYMAASALGFEDGGTGVHQILASRRPDTQPYGQPVPLTRDDIYAC